MQPKGTSKEPPPFFKLSTWIIIIICSSCIAVVFMFLLSLSVGCHAFVSPMLACFAERRVLCAPQGLPPCRCGDGLQMRARYLLLPSPCQPGLVSNGKSHLSRGSFGHDTQRSQQSNLRVVWRGSQRVNSSVCYNYVCLLCICHVKSWWNCGWRWDNKCNLFQYQFHSIFKFISS